MQKFNMTTKRISLYIIGLFFLSLGVSFSIQANLGVSPVSSLAYAFALSFGFSVGLMTVVTNVLFICLQIILKKRFDHFKNYIIQLIVAFLFGFFIDVTLFLLQLLPTPDTLWMQWVFMIFSLITMPIGLFCYFSPKYPLMPYDALTHVLSDTFNIKFSKAKISGDLANVILAGLISIIFTRSLGSIGIGTVVAAYSIGKILGWLTKHFQKPLDQWLNHKKVYKTRKARLIYQKESTHEI